MVTVTAASANTGRVKLRRPIIDTIIKLDSVRDRNLLKGKKSAPNPVIKNTPSTQDTSTKDDNGLKSIITAHADDSTRVDDIHNILYLYGKARVTYEDFELEADFIRVDQV